MVVLSFPVAAGRETRESDLLLCVILRAGIVLDFTYLTFRRQTMELRIVPLLILLSFLFASCENPVAPVASPLTPALTTELPNSSNLIGVWNDVANVRVGNNTEKISRKITFASGNLWSQSSTTEIIPPSGSSTFSYAENEGVFSVSGDILTTTVHRHRNSSTPFSDSTTGWVDSSTSLPESKVTAFLYSGKLYANPKYPAYKISGSHTGLVGTWVAIQSSVQTSWSKYVYDFQDSDSVVYSSFSSSSSTFSATPTVTLNFDYVRHTDTELELFFAGTGSSQAYLQVGDYFLTGAETHVGAATKE